MISSASVLATKRSRVPAHDGQMRYASRLFFKHSHYNNGHKKHKRHKKHINKNKAHFVLFVPFVLFVLFVALITIAVAARDKHAKAILIFGGLEEIAD